MKYGKHHEEYMMIDDETDEIVRTPAWDLYHRMTALVPDWANSVEAYRIMRQHISHQDIFEYCLLRRPAARKIRRLLRRGKMRIKNGLSYIEEIVPLTP